MLTQEQQWEVAISTIEKLHQTKLAYPLSESAYTIFGYLVFNPDKPVPADVKTLVKESFSMIFGKNKIY